MTLTVLKRCPTLIASILIAASQAFPVWSQAQQVGYYPAPELANVPGLIYDPPPEAQGVSFSHLPGASSPGWVVVDDPNLTYDPNRAWPAGATPDRIIKFGDLKQNPQFAGFTQHSLRDFNNAIGTDIGGVPIGQIELVNGLNLEQVKDIYNNGDIKLKDSAPLFKAVVGVVLDPTGAQKQLQRNVLSTSKKILINELNQNPALKDISFEDLLDGDWKGALQEGEQVLLREIGNDIPPELRRLPVGSLTIEVIEGNWESARQRAQNYAIDEIQNFTLNEVIKEFPELKRVPIGGIIHIANQPLDQALPQLADMALEQFPGIEDKILGSVPGLSDTALGSIIAPIVFNLLAGDIFGRFDIAHSGQDGPEEHYGRPISGGTPDAKFKPEHGIKSATSRSKRPERGFPRFEMAPLEPGTTILGDPLLGKEWMSRDQEVPGCKGFLCLFGNKERAGIKPFGNGSLTKFSLGNITEYDDKPAEARLWVDFQICVTILFEKHCTAHIFSFKTPWKVKVGGIFPILARRRVQDYFPGINERARTIDFCQVPDFLGGTTTAGNSPPPQGEAEAFEQFKSDSAVIGLSIDRDPQGRLLVNEENEDATIAWVAQEAGTYGFEVNQADNGTITFNYTGVTHPSPSKSATTSNDGFSGVYPGTLQNQQSNSSLQSEAQSNGVQLQAIDGSTNAPRLDGIPGRPGAVSSQGSSATKPSDPQHRLRQYLARIALGESSGGTDIDAHPNTGAYGEYQFIPETRQIILDRYGLDAWSTNKVERDQAAVALIQAFGDEIGTDILGLIEAGEFEQADQLLGQHVYSRAGNVIRYGQFTSLPGGAEEHEIWKDPAILAQYGPNGDAGQNPLLAAINTNSQRCNPALLASNGPLTPEGTGIATGTYSSPLPHGSYTFTDYFAHFHTGRGRPHLGVDLGAAKGTPVLSVEAGTIDHIGWDPDGYGNFIVVGHPNGTGTLYGHLSEVNVRQGQTVDNLDQIGKVGNTGRSRGDHLHFEFLEGYTQGNHRSGYPVDPEKYFNFR
ncbi:M23 family metallopeptidase [Acaryochloris marina]|uniref:M23 family metallopeptidase n=1 Tax=Acaryochloris marina TaxID=155978 RepID=UPI0021C31B78|nr:M23 family metallopeptidase [Acaryochloris marina]